MSGVDWWKTREAFWGARDRWREVQVGQCGNVGKVVSGGEFGLCDGELFRCGEQVIQGFRSGCSQILRSEVVADASNRREVPPLRKPTRSRGSTRSISATA